MTVSVSLLRTREKERSCVFTPKICSSSSSLKTVPVIWFGFKACQFNNGILNLVWMVFLLLIPEETKSSGNDSNNKYYMINISPKCFTFVNLLTR